MENWIIIPLAILGSALGFALSYFVIRWLQKFPIPADEAFARIDVDLHDMIHEIGKMELDPDNKAKADMILKHLEDAHGIVHDLDYNQLKEQNA